MARRGLIAGNWKMNKTPEETEAFLDALLPRFADHTDSEIVLVPPYTSLEVAGRRLAGSSVRLGAQDLFHEPSGAYTGAISAPMLVACGCDYVLVGHSERRQIFAEDDVVVRRKLRAALDGGLVPILCVGETLQERRAGNTVAVLTRQLVEAFAGVAAGEIKRVVIAYEPVWAIGTGETATPEQAQEAISGIRAWHADRFGARASARLRILYGGSVKPGNAAELLTQPDIDGALVGGASLDVDSFGAIVGAKRRGKETR